MADSPPQTIPSQIISFYEFKRLRDLEEITSSLKYAMSEFGVRGTIIVAEEGYNGMVCGEVEEINGFVKRLESVLQSTLVLKSSFHEKAPFRKIDVKIKPEIVTLKQAVDFSLADGTHVKPNEWNELISDPSTLVLDARNEYEYQTGTFRGAVNPKIAKFSELPDFVNENLDPKNTNASQCSAPAEFDAKNSRPI